MGKDQKNAFLAVILSALVLFGWQTYFALSNSFLLKLKTVLKMQKVKLLSRQRVQLNLQQKLLLLEKKKKSSKMKFMFLEKVSMNIQLQIN